ncbi:MAG: acyl-CoA dehydrogenase family protein [Haloglomus sp.]
MEREPEIGAVDTASYAMEILGGNSALSGFVTERLYRDTQIHPIWEGATNMMAFDVLRSVEKVDAHEVAFEVIDERLRAVDHESLAALRETVAAERDGLKAALGNLLVADRDHQELHGKQFADYPFEVYVAALLLAEAQTHIDERDDGRKAMVARRFVDHHLREQENRGIGTDDLRMRAFDAIVRYGLAGGAVERKSLPRAGGTWGMVRRWMPAATRVHTISPSL